MPLLRFSITPPPLSCTLLLRLPVRLHSLLISCQKAIKSATLTATAPESPFLLFTDPRTPVAPAIPLRRYVPEDVDHSSSGIVIVVRSLTLGSGVVA